MSPGSMVRCQKYIRGLVCSCPLGYMICAYYLILCLCLIVYALGEQTGGGSIQRMHNFLPVEWYLVWPQMRPNFTQKTSQKLPFLKIPDPYPQTRMHLQIHFISPPVCQWAKMVYDWLYLLLWLNKAGGLCSCGPGVEWPRSCKPP